MLRALTGDEPLAQALTAWRSQPVLHTSPEAQAVGFEKLLEKTSGKDLAWFFRDWVLHDRGLPDLSIVSIEPRQLPAGQGHDVGWLVAVTMRNDGAATADVPLILRSGALDTTARVRIPAFTTITERYVLPAPPTQIQLNDGNTPEQQTSLHTRDITLKPE
jgi:aminopeptidase N